jgi:hypothetical protein
MFGTTLFATCFRSTIYKRWYETNTMFTNQKEIDIRKECDEIAQSLKKLNENKKRKRFHVNPLSYPYIGLTGIPTTNKKRREYAEVINQPFWKTKQVNYLNEIEENLLWRFKTLQIKGTSCEIIVNEIPEEKFPTILSYLYSNPKLPFHIVSNLLAKYIKFNDFDIVVDNDGDNDDGDDDNDIYLMIILIK